MARVWRISCYSGAHASLPALILHCQLPFRSNYSLWSTTQSRMIDTLPESAVQVRVHTCMESAGHFG